MRDVIKDFLWQGWSRGGSRSNSWQTVIDGDTKIDMKSRPFCPGRLGISHRPSVTGSPSRLEEKGEPLSPHGRGNRAATNTPIPNPEAGPASHGGRWKTTSRGRPKPAGPTALLLRVAQGALGGGAVLGFGLELGAGAGLLQKDLRTVDEAKVTRW